MNRHVGILVFVTLVWGTTFPLLKSAAVTLTACASASRTVWRWGSAPGSPATTLGSHACPTS